MKSIVMLRYQLTRGAPCLAKLMHRLLLGALSWILPSLSLFWQTTFAHMTNAHHHDRIIFHIADLDSSAAAGCLCASSLMTQPGPIFVPVKHPQSLTLLFFLRDSSNRYPKRQYLWLGTKMILYMGFGSLQSLATTYSGVLANYFPSQCGFRLKGYCDDYLAECFQIFQYISSGCLCCVVRLSLLHVIQQRGGSADQNPR